MNELTKAKIRKNNMKLYPWYTTLSVDLIFFHVVKFLFLTQIREISASMVVLSVSIYAFYMIFLQMPITYMIKKIGFRNGIIVGNLCNVVYVMIILFSSNIFHLLIAELMSAFCFSFKNIAEPSLLNISIPKTQKKSNLFSKIDQKGQARFYYIDSITTMLAGFLYAVNPYLPFILTILTSCICALLAKGFINMPIEGEEAQKNSIFKNFKTILQSQRMVLLLLYSGLMTGILALIADYRTSLLVDLQVSAQATGIIVAMIGILAGLSAKRVTIFNNKYHNHSLTYIALGILILIALAGFITLIPISSIFIIAIVVFCFSVIKMLESLYRGLMRRYLSNFATPLLIDKIYSAQGILDNTMRMLIGFLGSFLLSQYCTAEALIILSMLFVPIVLLLLYFMKRRVGLKPENYEKKEIFQ